MGIDTITALAAIFIAVWQARLMRVHNRLSVKPHLQIDFHNIDGEARLKIKNGGIGPAFIMEFNIYIKNRKIESFTYEKWFDCLTELGIHEKDHSLGYSYDHGDAISAQESALLVSFNSDDYLSMDILKDLKIEIIYQDAYGTKFSTRYN